MKSKEALKTLFSLLCEREHTNSEHNFWLKLYQVINKDLEVLEILKGKILLISDLENINDFEKVKGWLYEK